MDKNEMLIDLMREMGKSNSRVWCDARLMNRIADALENQENELKALRQITEKQAGLNQDLAKVALELDRTKALLDMAREERDAVTKGMIQLEVKYAMVLNDFQQSLLGEPCDYCGNHFENDERCGEDLDCEKCGHDDCVCKRCIDCDSWTWRGLEAGHAEA